MPNQENRPEIHPSSLEPIPMPAKIADDTHTVLVYRNEKDILFVRVQHEETVIFTMAVTPENAVHLHVPAALTPVSPDMQSLPPVTISPETKEQEQPVMLRGRIGTEIRRLSSPTGGAMAVFSFAEHPHRSLWSYTNTLPDAEKPAVVNNTVWWPVAAFDENVALLDGAVKGKEYDLTCYKRSWKETGKNGKEKTVNGFSLLGLQPVTKRPRYEPPKEPQARTEDNTI